MLMTTTDEIPGRDIQTIGLVTANAVRSRNVGRDILAVVKTITGGEVGAYRQLLVESRQEAWERLEEEAKALGADGIVGMRIATASIAQGVAEILAYGTAVKIR